MDQGIAALLGATVGVVGALGTAALAFFGVRYQARATGQIEHQKALWNERIAAYSAFIEAVQGAHNVLLEISAKLRKYSPDPETPANATAAQDLVSRLQEAKDRVSAAYECMARIYVVGPQQLVDCTTGATQALNQRVRVMSQGLTEILSGVHESARWEAEEAEQRRIFVTKFGGFTARAAHVVEGHQLPNVEEGAAIHGRLSEQRTAARRTNDRES